jgi:hypothetical protein
MDLQINRWLLALALALALAVASCRKSTAMNHHAQPVGTVLTIALDHRFAPLAFSPGRYATAIQRTMHGTHALQVLNEDSTSSLVLDLAADGTARACRGWRYHFRNDGPEVQTEDHYREQQGYRGRYTVIDGVVEVMLALDNAVCPHVFEGGLALARSPSVKLRCVLATPSGEGELSGPVLLCQPTDGKPAELEPYVVEQLAPTGWFVLGSGNGLRVWVTGRPPGAMEGDDVKMTAKTTAELVGENAWEQAF